MESRYSSPCVLHLTRKPIANSQGWLRRVGSHMLPHQKLGPCTALVWLTKNNWNSWSSNTSSPSQEELGLLTVFPLPQWVKPAVSPLFNLFSLLLGRHLHVAFIKAMSGAFMRLHVCAVCAGELGLTPLLSEPCHTGCETTLPSWNKPPVHQNWPSEVSNPASCAHWCGVGMNSGDTRRQDYSKAFLSQDQRQTLQLNTQFQVEARKNSKASLGYCQVQCQRCAWVLALLLVSQFIPCLLSLPLSLADLWGPCLDPGGILEGPVTYAARLGDVCVCVLLHHVHHPPVSLHLWDT